MSKLNPKPILKPSLKRNKMTDAGNDNDASINHDDTERGDKGSFLDNFDSSSFVLGLFAGVVIRWSDILPLTGGILIGVSIRNIPRWLEMDQLPLYLKQAGDIFKEKTLGRKE